ncbi:MAG TPA: hypothetical protein VGI39_25550 [Polyangiaceae bacterium]
MEAIYEPLLLTPSDLAEMRAKEMTRPSAAPVIADVLAGLVAGAASGLVAGPAGLVVGAALGGALGLSAGLGLEFARVLAKEHDNRLDRDLGVLEGEVGAGVVAGLEYPPAILGLYSSGSVASALVGRESPPSEGPMQEPD